MPTTTSTHTIDVYGNFACFTRPETKIERWSYPLPTPSAARGILDSIYWDGPQFRWQVRRIEILKPIRLVGIRRNEVKEVVQIRDVLRWMAGERVSPIVADATPKESGSDEKGRTQRQTMTVADVRYRITADITPWPGSESRLTAFREQFLRRLATGKCAQQPYLGCREFVAFFSPPDASYSPIPLDQDLGFMVYDQFDLATPEGRRRQSVFHATIAGGVMHVPHYSDPAVLKAE